MSYQRRKTNGALIYHKWYRAPYRVTAILKKIYIIYECKLALIICLCEKIYIMWGCEMRKVCTFLYLTIPSILVNLYISFEVRIVLIYLISIVGVVLFFKFNPCKFYALILGLLLSPLFSVIVSTLEYRAYINRGDNLYAAVWQYGYLFSIVCVIYYVLPFIIISIIIKKVKRTV